MNAEQRDYILKNHRRFSSRQIAKKLGLSRTEIEKFIRAIKKEPALETPTQLTGNKGLLIVLTLFIFAWALRLFTVHLFQGTPFFEPLSVKLDDGVYDLMGQQISAGNWGANTEFSAYRIPLYPYFLAVIYRLFGHQIVVVHIIQSFLGAVSCVLLFLIAQQTFKNYRSAIIAAALGALYIPFIFFENLLLGETLSIFLNLAAMSLLTGLWCDDKHGLPKTALAGLLFGLSILLRPNTFIPVLFLALLMCIVFGIRKKAFLKSVILPVIFLASAAVAILPVTIRNYALHKDFIPLSAVGGINFYLGNNPEADGKFHLSRGIGTSLDEMIQNSIEVAENETGRPLKPSEVSSYWVRKTLRYIASSPGHFSALIFKKAGYFLNAYEFPDILDINFVSQFISLLRLGAVEYGLIMFFAIHGIILCFQRKTASALLPGCFLAGYAVSVILFFITARYRLPAVPFVIIFAAYAFNDLSDTLRTWKIGRLIQWGLISLAAAVLVFSPVQVTSFGTNYNSLAISLKNRGLSEEAEKYYKKAIEIEPNYPSPYHNMGLLLEDMGRSEEAADYYKKYEDLRRELSGPASE